MLWLGDSTYNNHYESGKYKTVIALFFTFLNDLTFPTLPLIGRGLLLLVLSSIKWLRHFILLLSCPTVNRPFKISPIWSHWYSAMACMQTGRSLNCCQLLKVIYTNVEWVGVHYSCLHAFIQWHHARPAGFFIHLYMELFSIRRWATG